MGPMVLESLLIFSVSLITPIGMFFLSIKKKPVWIPEGPLAPFWFKINTFSLIVSGVISLATIFIYHDRILIYRGLIAITTSILAYLLTQTIFTDFKQRYADRRILNIGSIVSVGLGLVFVNSYNSYPNLVLYIIMLILCLMILFIPSIGESDARALTVTFATSYPIVGMEGVQLAMILFVLFLLGYLIYLSFKEKSFKKALTSSVSTPMVPFIILPSLIIILIAPLLPI